MTDKIILTLIGLEWLAFGLVGLFNPLLIASMLEMQLGSLNAISEIRANYAFFACMGFIALFSLWRVKLMRTAYLTFCIVLGCFLLGRILSFILDGFPSIGGLTIFVNELIVYLLAIWRYQKREVLF